jgi:hypothetical protein
MSGGWEAFRCDRCPLVIELGGSTCWDEAGVVFAETQQVACADCGAMHRLTVEHGNWQAFALEGGPLRVPRGITIMDFNGTPIEHEDWVRESDWRLLDQRPTCLKELICSFCNAVGRMLTYEEFLYPGGYFPGRQKTWLCPICGGPMPCFSVSDAI